MESRGADDMPGGRGEQVTAAAVLAGLNLLGFGVLEVRASRIIAADDLVCAASGRSREELLALPDLSVCFAPEERHRVAERRHRRATGRVTPAPVSTVVIRPDGTRLPVEWAPVEVDLGSPERRLIVVIRDATDRAAHDLAVQRYERLIERTPMAVLIWETDGADDAFDMRLLSANHAAVTALAALAGDRTGERLGDIFPTSAEDAARTFALRGTGSVEFFPDYVIGDPERPESVHRRQAIDLGGGAVAFVMENVTGERVESLRRRRLLERLVDAGDDERRTLAMAVHDEPVQQLAAATMLVEALRRHPDSSERDLRLEAVEASLRATMIGLRRLLFELSPPELVDSGLRGALDSAVAYLFDGTDVVVTLDIDVPDEPPNEIQTAAFRIAAEALTNIRKHAAASHVLVDVQVLDRMLHLDIVDDGAGFPIPLPAGRTGLRTLRERATSVGGECEVTSGADGTRVHAVLPLSGRHTPADAAFAADLKVPVPDEDEVEVLRRERDSLVTSSDRQRSTLTLLGQQLDHVVALWATLDDATLSAPALLGRATRQIAALCRDGCGVRLLSADDQSWARIECWHADADQRRFLEQLMIAHDPTEVSHPSVALRGNAAVLLDRRASSWSAGSSRPLPSAPVEPSSAIIAPIRIHGEARGLLTVIRDVTAVRFVERDVDLVQHVADRLGAALARCLPDTQP